MRCAYCQISIASLAYACQCNPNVCVCFGCKQFGSCTCGKNFKEIKMARCDHCYKYVNCNKMLYESQIKYGSTGYCVKCCIEFYQKQDPRFMKYFGCTPAKKMNIEKFVRKFCYKCNNILKQDRSDSKQTLQNNLCGQCDKQSLPKQKHQEIEGSKKPKSSEIPEKTSQKQESPGKIKPKKSRAQLLDYWLRIQNEKMFPKCMSCQGIVVNTQNITIDEEVILCSMCTRFSMKAYQQSERNHARQDSGKLDPQNLGKQKNLSEWAENKNNQKPIKQNVNVAQKPYMMQSILQSVLIKNTQNQSLNKDEEFSQFSKNEQGQLKELQKIEHTKQDKLEVVQKSKQNLRCQKQKEQMGTETEPMKLKIQIVWRDDQDMIYCTSCRIQIQPMASIWEEENNKPICRCCFSDIIDNAREVQQRRLNRKYQRYVSKPKEEKQSTRENDIPAIVQTEQKGYKQRCQIDQSLSKTTAPKSKPFFEETQLQLKQMTRKDPDLNIQIEDLEGADIILSDNGPLKDRSRKKQKYQNEIKTQNNMQKVANYTSVDKKQKKQQIQNVQKLQVQTKQKKPSSKSVQQINLPIYKKSAQGQKQIIFETRPRKDNEQIVKNYRESNRRGVIDYIVAGTRSMYPPTHTSHILPNRMAPSRQNSGFECNRCHRRVNRQPKYVNSHGKPLCLECQTELSKPLPKRR